MHLFVNSYAGIIGDRNFILRENIHVCDDRLRGMDFGAPTERDGVIYLKRITVTYEDCFGITDTDTISS